MRYSWDRRIARATELAAAGDEGRALMTAYGRLLELQRQCFASFEAAAVVSGTLERDMPVITKAARPVVEEIAATGPEQAARDAEAVLDNTAALESRLLTAWQTASPGFIAKLLLQPYAELLAVRQVPLRGRAKENVVSACPICGAPPQLSILHADLAGDGGGRVLQCALCASTWTLRRVLCANCGEEDERQLGYYMASGIDHLRVDVCETCRHYLKAVDLTRLGIAVPVVDEVAGAALDLWAVERGYTKIEPNLVGI